MAGAAALPIIGGVMGAFGASQTANANSDAANYNAQVATQSAAYTDQQTAQNVRQVSVQAGQAIGSQRASYGASGVSGSTGSALDELRFSASNAALDVMNTQFAGQIKAWSQRSGAALDTMAAANDQTAGQYSAASAVLGAGSSAINAYRSS